MKHMKKRLLTLLLAVAMVCQSAMPVFAAESADKSETSVPKMTKLEVKGMVYDRVISDDGTQLTLVSEYKGQHFITVVDEKGQLIGSQNVTKLLKKYIKNYYGISVTNKDISDIEVPDRFSTYYCVDVDQGEPGFVNQYLLTLTVTKNGVKVKVEGDSKKLSDDCLNFDPYYYTVKDEKAVAGKKVSLARIEIILPDDPMYNPEYVFDKYIKTNVQYKNKNEVASLHLHYSYLYLILHDTVKDTYRYFYSTNGKKFTTVKTLQNTNAQILSWRHFENGFLVRKVTAKKIQYLTYGQADSLDKKKEYKITKKSNSGYYTTERGEFFSTGTKSYVLPYYYAEDSGTLDGVKASVVKFNAGNIIADGNDREMGASEYIILVDKTGYLHTSYNDINMFKSYKTFKCNAVKGKKYAKMLDYCNWQGNYSMNDPLILSVANKANYSDAVTYWIPEKFINQIEK